MKKSFRLILIAAGTVFLLSAGGCTATRANKKNCHCPSWGKEVNKHTPLQKSS